MKKTLLISVDFDQPDFLQQLVERLAESRKATGVDTRIVTNGYRLTETSSTETFVSGTLHLDIADDNDVAIEPMNIPFITCFAFTCVKSNSPEYQLQWASSLN